VFYKLKILIILMVGVTLETKVRNDAHTLYEIHLIRSTVPILKREIDSHIILEHAEGRESSNVTISGKPGGVKTFNMSLIVEILEVSFQRLIDDESKNIEPFNASANGHDSGWKNSNELETIYAWLHHLAKKYNDLVSVIIVEKRFEGRPINGVQLSYRNGNTGVLVESAIHGKELIGQATTSFILHHLLTLMDFQTQYYNSNHDRILSILMVGVASETKFRYDNHILYEVRLNRSTVSRMKREIVRHIVVDHANGRDISNVTVLVEPGGVKTFNTMLAANNISHEILEINFQRLIDDESKNIVRFNASANGTDFGWKNYYELETIYAWLDHIAEKYSDLISVIIVGKSFEGRPIKGVKLSHKKNNTAVFVEAGIHGKEWISPATATFILNQLLTSTDSEIQYFAENFDWIIFPICNPDGYKYTFDNDRLWRKNRQVFDDCFGVDLNRNWNVSWNFKNIYPCSSSFPGTHEFSAPETKGIAAYLLENVESQRIKTYLSFHSASQKLLFPYAVNGSRPPNFDDLLNIGQRAAEALENRFGKRFQVGAVFDVLYGAKGTSLDWAYTELKVPLVYVYELRRSAAKQEELEHFQARFLLPVDEIEAAGWETLDSVVALLDEATTLGYFQSNDSPMSLHHVSPF
ncbi:Zinc carboxypeptidase A 1, partial [Pseudolycoriella hygida]